MGFVTTSSCFRRAWSVSPLWRVPASGGAPVPITPVAKKETGWDMDRPDRHEFVAAILARWQTLSLADSGAQGDPSLFVGRLDSD